MSDGNPRQSRKLRPSRKGQGKGRVRGADRPIAFFSGEGCIPETAWKAAQEHSELELDDRLRATIENLLAAYATASAAERRAPSAEVVSNVLTNLVRALSAGSEALATLADSDNPAADSARRILRQGVRLHTNWYHDNPSAPFVNPFESETARAITAILLDRKEIKRLSELVDFGLGATQRALEATQTVGSTSEKTALLLCLDGLRWVFMKAGGKVTKGSESYITPFARFAFALIDGLPAEQGKPSITEINNVIRNHLLERPLVEPTWAFEG